MKNTYRTVSCAGGKIQQPQFGQRLRTRYILLTGLCGAVQTVPNGGRRVPVCEAGIEFSGLNFGDQIGGGGPGGLGLGVGD